MKFHMVFCADGVLRAQYNNHPLIPMDFLQRNSIFHHNDFSFWTKWWDKNIIFEEGLTIATFLCALEPWASFWSTLLSKDIKSYIKESKKPTLIDDIDNRMSWISLGYNIELSPQVNYDTKNINHNVLEWLKQKTRFTGKWDISECYQLTGYIKDTNEHYFIHHLPFNTMANVPLVLLPNQMLYVLGSFKINESIGQEHSLFNSNALGLKKVQVGQYCKSTQEYIEGSKSHNLREIIEGFFSNFLASPAVRDQTNQIINNAINKSFSITQEETIEIDNVISLATGKPKKLKEDDFASTNYMENLPNNKSEDYWQQMLQLAKKDNEVYIKIGKVNSASPIEDRVLGKLINHPEQL